MVNTIPKEVEDRLEHWDLFVRNGYILTTGKSWPHSLKGDIALYSDYKDTWSVRWADSFHVSHNTDVPYIDWYNTGKKIAGNKFIEYMDLLRDITTHLAAVNNDLRLIDDLKRRKT